MTELREGDVGTLASDGTSTVWLNGSPEAEAWKAENSGSHDLVENTPEDAPKTEPGPGEPIDPNEADPSEPDDGFRGDPDAPQPKNAPIPEEAK